MDIEKPNCIGCPHIHPDNGNCTAVGGFCTAVPAAHCPLIPELLARAEAAEQKATELDNALSNASKVVKTMQENTIPYYRKRVELAEKEVEWKNKVIEAAERRFIEAEAENEKLKNCRNQCKIVFLLEKYNEMEEKMIKEKERAEKAERKLNSLLDEEETVAFDPFGVQKEE